MKCLVLSKYPGAFCKKNRSGYIVRLSRDKVRYVSFESTPQKAWERAAFLLDLISA